MRLRLFIIIICFFGISAVSHAAEEKALKVFEVKRKIFNRPLFFNGYILPLKQYNVTTPNEGTVVEKFFEYGQYVKKGDVLVKVSSLKLESDYHTTLTGYLTSKDKYLQADSKFKSEEFLYKQGLISEDEYKGARSSLLSANVSYLQSLYTLNESIKIGQELAEDVTQLDISDIEAVEKALKIKYNHLNLTATENGIALYPPDSHSGRSGDMIEVGSQLKHGQVVVVIGDLSGVELKIQVTEIDVGQIHEGLKAEVTGVAFPDHKLDAAVKRVDLQASNDGGGGLPTFGVDLEVEHLTDEQKQDIRVGMSATIKLNIEKEGAIEVPIDAIQKKGNLSFVDRLDANGKVSRVPVMTGQTSLDNVEVKIGLKDGDRIIIPDQAE